MEQAKAPIDALLGRTAFRCTKCGEIAWACQCWTRCECGWTYEMGGTCRNPLHVVQAVAGDVAATVLDSIRDLRSSAILRSRIEKATYDAVFDWATEFMKPPA